MRLHEMQQHMFDQIRKPLESIPAKHAADFMKSTAALDAEARLEIYKRSYWHRLIDAFNDDFPGLLTILGESDFDRLTRMYLAEYPSRSFTLRDLGQYLETWILKNPDFCGSKHAICLDMVRLELAHIEAFDGAENPVITLDELRVAGAELQMQLQPHLRLLILSRPVDDVRLDSNALADALHFNGEQIYLATYRSALSVYYKRLRHEEYIILRALNEGAALAEAIEKGCQNSELELDQQTQAIHKSFETWMRLGWFCRREKC